MRTGGFPHEDPAATAPWEPAYPSDWLTCSECGVPKESVYAHSPVCDECHAEGRPRDRVFAE